MAGGRATGSLRSMRSFLLPLAAVASCVLVMPAAASAVSLTREGDTFVLTGDPGPDHLMTRYDDDTTDRFVIAGASFGANMPDGCIPGEWDRYAHCVVTAGGLRVDGGGGDDKLEIEFGTPAALKVHVLGGAGDDTLRDYSDGGNVLDGGDGADSVTGGPGNDTVLGGPGDDLVVGDGFTGTFADVIDGGPGYDRSEGDWTNPTQGAPTPPASVSLNGVADDGRPGEGDNATGIERIRINHAATLIAGLEAVDFEIPSNAGTVKAKRVGSPAADKLKAAHGPDEIDGGAGDDNLEGGYGDDLITGGAGKDTINADASGGCDIFVCNAPVGNDTVLARDGEADSIACGVGTDRAVVDAIDTTSACETVEVGAADRTPPGGGAGGTPPGGGSGQPGAQRCTVPKVKAGTKLSTARKRLAAAGCRTKVVKIRSRKYAKHRVVRLSKRAGGTVSAGKRVTVYVSKGVR